MSVQYICDKCDKPAILRLTIARQTLPGKTRMNTYDIDLCEQHARVEQSIIAGKKK